MQKRTQAMLFYRLIPIVILAMIISPLWMYFSWKWQDEKNLNVFILDKSVLDISTQEHNSLIWVLRNNKYVHSQTGMYNPQTDYHGFFPLGKRKFRINDLEKFDSKDLDSIVRKNDLLYYTDLYGIYKREWEERYPTENDSMKHLTQKRDDWREKPVKIYGGMTTTELDLLKRMKLARKSIISEFNTIASPTPENVRKGFEKEFHMKWTGWVGRYYILLDSAKNKDLPRWLIESYMKQHNHKWPFTKSGIAFVRNDDKLEILEFGTHLDVEVPVIHTIKRFQYKYNVPEIMKYPFWFDIISLPDSTNSVVANYQLDPNPEGEKILKELGIPLSFPAIIEHDKTDYRFWYFAGDFCDNPIELKSSTMKYIEYLSGLFYVRSMEERNSFFWDYYRPLLETILAKVNHLK